jgi:preprotein translocase subunit SecY
VFESLLNAFRAPDIRRRILVVLGLLIVFRFLAAVPVPGINRDQLASFLSGNPLFGLLDLFSGGGLSHFSVVALGMNPYINASIIMQLMQGVVPSLQALSREGEYGRNKITQYTRYLSVPMAMLQAYGFLALLNSNNVLVGRFDLGSFDTLTQIATLTAGAVALMWIGELITERGIGNGISFIIFAVSILLFPVQLASYFTASEIGVVKSVAEGIVTLFNPRSVLYVVLYFLLTVGFTYFYTAFTFKPDETAEQLRKNGGFIPGIRPGRPTQDYLSKVVTRITFAGALFLAVVAVSPTLMGIAFPDLGAIGLGGTSLLIVVSVVVETMKQIEAQLMMCNYEGFIR